jgi:hypothetical protein
LECGRACARYPHLKIEIWGTQIPRCQGCTKGKRRNGVIRARSAAARREMGAILRRRWCRRRRRVAESAQAMGMGKGTRFFFVRHAKAMATIGMQVARKIRWRRARLVVAWGGWLGLE